MGSSRHLAMYSPYRSSVRVVLFLFWCGSLACFCRFSCSCCCCCSCCCESQVTESAKESGFHIFIIKKKKSESEKDYEHRRLLLRRYNNAALASCSTASHGSERACSGVATMAVGDCGVYPSLSLVGCVCHDAEKGCAGLQPLEVSQRRTANIFSLSAFNARVRACVCSPHTVCLSSLNPSLLIL